ncbi:MAG: fused MFS/spermidine synthase [Bacteroidia bacterium]|nr:fused MFS/spermidine synthase [Bacteroidia bacterium]
MRYRLLYWYGEPIIAGERVHYVGGNLARAWREAFERLGIEERSWHSVLLVGMGATLIQLLARSPNPPARLTVLEIDEEMVRLQKTYFHLPLAYEVVIGDAAETIHALTLRYDGIFVDAFVEEEVPESLIDFRFVEALRERLSEQGILIWNVLRRSQANEVGSMLSMAFPVCRRWSYAPHVFWACAFSAASFPLPF